MKSSVMEGGSSVAGTGGLSSCDLRNSTPGSPTSPSEAWIDRSIHYMKEHLNAPLPVPRLAALASVSPSHFFALFKRRTGFTPMDFFIRLRMQRACDLLDTTAFNVKEIANLLGYEDPFYFSRVFKSVNGLAPSDYRALRATEIKPRNGKVQPQPQPQSPIANERNNREDSALLHRNAANGHVVSK